MRKDFLFDEYDDEDGPSDDELLSMELGEDDDDGDEWALDSEIVVRVSDSVEGSRTLQELAARLYDYADELLTMLENGWELVGEIVEGQGVTTHKKHDE